MELSKKQIQHLYWRAGFGVNPSDLNKLEGKSLEVLVDELFESSKRFAPLEMKLAAGSSDQKKQSKNEKKKQAKINKTGLHELNVLWMTKLATTEAVLREKMTLFFHDHFAVRIKSPVDNLTFNNLLREHALGDFGKLLVAVSKSPAMLSFLNNKQNVKDHPNENFAREVLELFTLGRDNGYTEKDIHEAARAFTGWSYDEGGNFVIHQKKHDDGSKTFLGHTGNFNGDDILQLILKEKQTAIYLTEKLIDLFIGRELPGNRVEYFASVFFNANYDLQTLIRALLISDDFMDARSIGCKIKSPTEFLTGMTRLFEVDFKEKTTLVQIQRKLNQELFSPPNVAGWPGGRAWIDSSTLMLRLKAPSVILNFGVIEWDEKGDMPEDKLIQLEEKRDNTQAKVEKKMQAYPNWEAFEKKMKNEQSRLKEFLIQPELSVGAQKLLAVSDSVSLKDQAIEIVSLPEYQLF